MQALEIQDLRKTYGGGSRTVEALRGVTLTVAPGEFFALLGPNGAGKSTLIGILIGLVRKSSGQVRVLGHDLDLDRSGLKSCLGVVPQEFNFNIFESVLNTVLFQGGYYGLDPATARGRAQELLEQLELWERRREPVRNLSGGMKRRLMLARALVHRPRVLILDEPTAGLDIELRRSLWEFLITLNQAGTTILLTTHYLEEAEHLCRRVAIIDHGTILKDGSTKDLLSELSRQTFVLDLANRLSEAPRLEDFGVELKDDHTLEVELHSDQTLNQLFESLSAHQLQVKSMRTKSNRLEELFLRLVGKTAPV